MNTYVYQAPTGLVTIDTGYERSMKAVERSLRSHGAPFRIDDLERNMKYVASTKPRTL